MNVIDFPLYRYRATVTRIIDGDTVEVMLDLGDRTYRSRRIRLLGYDAPEMFQGDNREAGIDARDFLETIAPKGSRVYIETHLDRESFDRLLGYVYIPESDGRIRAVADLMVEAGMGVRA